MDYDWTGRIQGKAYVSFDDVDPAVASTLGYLKAEADFAVTSDGGFDVLGANITAALSIVKPAEPGTRAAAEGNPAVRALGVVAIRYPCVPGEALFKGRAGDQPPPPRRGLFINSQKRNSQKRNSQ